jgi:hypothetical protein
VTRGSPSGHGRGSQAATPSLNHREVDTDPQGAVRSLRSTARFYTLVPRTPTLCCAASSFLAASPQRVNSRRQPPFEHTRNQSSMADCCKWDVSKSPEQGQRRCCRRAKQSGWSAHVGCVTLADMAQEHAMRRHQRFLFLFTFATVGAAESSPASGASVQYQPGGRLSTFPKNTATFTRQAAHRSPFCTLWAFHFITKPVRTCPSPSSKKTGNRCRFF